MNSVNFFPDILKIPVAQSMTVLIPKFKFFTRLPSVKEFGDMPLSEQNVSFFQLIAAVTISIAQAAMLVAVATAVISGTSSVPIIDAAASASRMVSTNEATDASMDFMLR